MRAALSHHCILVEGIPGTGKTTAAKALVAGFERAGVGARWYLEEDHGHPVMPRPLLKQWREADFGARCAASFERFARSIPPDQTEVLEGTAFQSTARFLWAADRDEEIPGYLDGLARALEPVRPALLHLRPRDRARYFREFVLPTRGPEWTAKLVTYVEGTARAKRLGWRGSEGLVEFWARYGECADVWVAALPFPCRTFETDRQKRPDFGHLVQEWLGEPDTSKEAR